MADWRDRLRSVIKERPDLSMKSLSLRAGLSESAVRDALMRGRVPSIDAFLAIATASGVSAGWLLQGDERFRIEVPLVGFVSGGEGWTPFPEQSTAHPQDKVEFELGDHDVIAIEVRGNSMAPVYRDRDRLFCQRRTANFAHNLIGQDCVLRTAEGEHFIKILQKSSKTGRFNLRSYNPVFKDIEDVALEWAAPVIWIRRGAV
jgi:lambda repressor-like predicted transcriptional regulator